MKIRKAEKKDARFLAKTVISAIGEDICADFAGGNERLPLIYELFEGLAERDDSQYSYTNAFIAEENDQAIGAIIGYDGARLRSLRSTFVTLANEILGMAMTDEEFAERGDEADSDEFYLDSLFVESEYRNRGIGSELIRYSVEANKNSGKPMGLLVEPENLNAKRLYEKLGFMAVGENAFFGAPMIHMQLTPP